MCVLPFSEKTRRQLSYEITYLFCKPYHHVWLAPKWLSYTIQNFKVFLIEIQPAADTASPPLSQSPSQLSSNTGSLAPSLPALIPQQRPEVFFEQRNISIHNFRAFISLYVVGVYRRNLGRSPSSYSNVVWYILSDFLRCLFLFFLRNRILPQTKSQPILVMGYFYI